VTSIRPLDPPAPSYADTILLLPSLLSGNECAALVEAAERVGFGATNYPKSYRGNLRLVATDRALASALWERLCPFVPASLERRCPPYRGESAPPTETWDAVGLNECFRLAKYYPTDRFEAHCDAYFERSPGGDTSLYTVNVYLNTLPAGAGGATRFYARADAGRAAEAVVDLRLVAEAGLACVFRQPPDHKLVHDGEAVGPGLVKYLLRTDVMYRRRA